MKAIWNSAIVADSDSTIVVEGNHYFPRTALVDEHFEASDKRTMCPWKGEAHYYDVVVNGDRNAAAAWFYPETKEAANNIRGYVAFWQGVDIVP